MEEKNTSNFDFRAWIKSLNSKNYELIIEDDDHYRLKTEYGLAEINFYPDEIVEISISSFKNGESKYYLHFQMKDEEHTKTLFREMEEALLELENEREIKVLLSCSSGFTTSYFAQKLNEAAKTLELDYTFNAVSYFDLYDQAENYDIILLAPQIGYMIKKIEKSLSNLPVLQIPTPIFASYDAMKTLEFIQSEMKERIQKAAVKEEKVGDCSNCSKMKKTTLCLAELYDGTTNMLYYRIYDKGTILLDEFVVKKSYHEIPRWDTIDYCLAKYPDIDQIVLATPGAVDQNGLLHFRERHIKNQNLSKEIADRYHKPAFIINNSNAAALGYHVLHPEYQTITYHSQPYGKANGGQGNIVNGQLVNGLGGISGEVKHFLYRMQFSDQMVPLARTEQGQLELVINSLLPTITILGPEIVVLRTPMVNDMTQLQARLANFIPENSLPKLEFIEDPKELIFEGCLALADKKKKEKKQATA